MTCNNIWNCTNKKYIFIQEKTIHLPETKFNFNEYSEYPDNTDKVVGPLAPQWNQILSSNRNLQIQNVNSIDSESSSQSLEALDPSKNFILVIFVYHYIYY